MTTVGAQQSSKIYTILLDSTSRRVLMTPGEKGKWTLPGITIPGTKIWMANAGVVGGPIKEWLRADVTILRGVHSEYSADGLNVELIYVLENHSAGWSLPMQG